MPAAFRNLHSWFLLRVIFVIGRVVANYDSKHIDTLFAYPLSDVIQLALTVLGCLARYWSFFIVVIMLFGDGPQGVSICTCCFCFRENAGNHDRYGGVYQLGPAAGFETEIPRCNSSQRAVFVDFCALSVAAVEGDASDCLGSVLRRLCRSAVGGSRVWDAVLGLCQVGALCADD